MGNSDSFDDIPDTIEMDGKIHPFDKEGYKKWAIAVGKRILAFIQNGPMRVKLGGKLLTIWDPGKFIRIDPDGRPHDHGTGFRVFPDNLDLCFSNREKVMG